MHRFHLPPEQIKQDTLVLTDAEAHHFLKVLRGREGERVTVFDGAGQECLCVVSKIEKGKVTLHPQQRNTLPRLPCQLTLAQAVPKGSHMDLILQKATELGVHRIAPLLSDRTVVRFEPEDAGPKMERWKQITIEAAKQCGANWLPVVDPPCRPHAFFSSANRSDLNLIGSLQPDALPLSRIIREYREEHGRRPSSATIAIGPEGDFTPAELADARSAGFRPLTLGPLVLRSETAAMYALSILSYELQQGKAD